MGLNLKIVNDLRLWFHGVHIDTVDGVPTLRMSARCLLNDSLYFLILMRWKKAVGIGDE